jgi:hypothetical protein
MIRFGEFKKTNPDLVAVVIAFILLRVWVSYSLVSTIAILQGYRGDPINSSGWL